MVASSARNGCQIVHAASNVTVASAVQARPTAGRIASFTRSGARPTGASRKPRPASQPAQRSAAARCRDEPRPVDRRVNDEHDDDAQRVSRPIRSGARSPRRQPHRPERTARREPPRDHQANIDDDSEYTEVGERLRDVGVGVVDRKIEFEYRRRAVAYPPAPTPCSESCVKHRPPVVPVAARELRAREAAPGCRRPTPSSSSACSTRGRSSSVNPR